MSCLCAPRDDAAHLVVVGASFAGLQVAKDAAGRLRVTVVDPKDYFEFTPSLHTALGAARDAASLLKPLDGSLVPGARFVRGAAVGADETRVSVRTERGVETVAYDYLVIACGCSYPAPIREAVDAADQTRARRLARIASAEATLGGAGAVLVVGGGAVGVEVAAELATSGPRSVTLATAAPELLPDMPAETRGAARVALRALGVEMLFETRCDRVAPAADPAGGAFELKSAGGVESRTFDACVRCFGARPQTAWLDGFCARDARGFVVVDDRGRCAVGDAENVWAAGDCAAKPDAQRLASYAHFEGEYVAGCILAAAAGSAQPEPYAPPPRLVALSFGPRDGAFAYDAKPVPVPGALVPWLKTVIEHWFIRLLPMPDAVR